MDRQGVAGDHQMTTTPVALAWLIELGSLPPQWFTGRAAGGFTTDANDAIRFAREEDARRAMFYVVDPMVARGCKIVEHGWSDRPKPGLVPGPQAMIPASEALVQAYPVWLENHPNPQLIPPPRIIFEQGWNAALTERALGRHELEDVIVRQMRQIEDMREFASEIERETWAAAADRLVEELHKVPKTRVDVWDVVEGFRARAAAHGET